MASDAFTEPINTVKKGITEYGLDIYLLHSVKKNELRAPIKTNYN